jgi:putative Holliday junction resolvase
MSEPSPEGERPAPGPCLGVDLGTVRIGVAVTDSARTVATARGVIARCGEEQRDHQALARLVEELGATLVVIGVPLSLDGGIGPAAGRVIAETARLAAHLRVPVATVDERLSTVEATRRLREAEELPARRGSPGARRAGRRPPAAGGARLPVDATAAAVILQSYIDRARQA